MGSEGKIHRSRSMFILEFWKNCGWLFIIVTKNRITREVDGQGVVVKS